MGIRRLDEKAGLAARGVDTSTPVRKFQPAPALGAAPRDLNEGWNHPLPRMSHRGACTREASATLEKNAGWRNELLKINCFS